MQNNPPKNCMHANNIFIETTKKSYDESLLKIYSKLSAVSRFQIFILNYIFF